MKISMHINEWPSFRYRTLATREAAIRWVKKTLERSRGYKSLGAFQPIAKDSASSSTLAISFPVPQGTEIIALELRQAFVTSINP